MPGLGRLGDRHVEHDGASPGGRNSAPPGHLEGDVIVLSGPGATATEFAQSSGNAESRLFRFGAMSASEVALGGYRAMQAGKRMV